MRIAVVDIAYVIQTYTLRILPDQRKKLATLRLSAISQNNSHTSPATRRTTTARSIFADKILGTDRKGLNT
jgi:hypothetical protein